MRVLLLQAYLGGGEPLVFPLGLSLLAATLKDHEVEVCDLNTFTKPFAELEERAARFSPDVVGISLRNIDSTNKRKVVFYYGYLKRTLEPVRSCCGAKTVIGGAGFSIFAREIMEEEPLLDYGVYLEGELVFRQLLDQLETPEQVPSVYYRKDGQVKFSGRQGLTPVSEVPLPAWDRIDLAPYRTTRNAFGVETKRGCVLNCIYCVYGFLNGKSYRLKQPERVVDEIESLVNDHGVKQFTFVDSIFNVPQDHARDICREMIRRKVDAVWSAWFNERFLDRDFLELAMRAGCNHVILSPDGYSDHVLKKLGKSITQNDVERSYQTLVETEGVEISYNFFKNPPGQSLAHVLRLIFFCFRAKRRLKGRVHFEFSSLRIEPHTTLSTIALAEGEIAEGESLLVPRYYTQRKTLYIEKMFNFLLAVRGK